MTDEPKPIDDGGPAYPWESFTGMSLRDYFAGVALSTMKDLGSVANHQYSDAAWAYSMADAMLKARKENAR